MSFARDSIRTFLVRISIIVISMVGGVIQARWLGPEGVGILALILLLREFAYRIGNLGFGSGFAFFIARGETSGQAMLQVAYILSGIMFVFSATVLLLVWRAPFTPWHDIPSAVFYAGLLTILPFSINNFLQRILAGQLNIRAVNISEILRIVFYLPVLVVLVVVFELGVIGAVFAFFIAQTGVAVYLVFCVQKKQDDCILLKGKDATWNKVFEIWRYCRWNYVVLGVNFVIDQLPLVLLKSYSSNYIVGFFSLGKSLSQRLRILPESFGKALFPYTAASLAEAAIYRTNMLCRNFIALTLGVVLVLVLAAKPVITILYGEAFVPAVKIVYVLGPAFVFWIFPRFLNSHISGFGESKTNFLLRLCALPVCVAACFLLIPRYGAVGAALSICVSNFILTILYVYVYMRLTQTKLAEMTLLTKSDWHFYKKMLFKGTALLRKAVS